MLLLAWWHLVPSLATLRVGHIIAVLQMSKQTQGGEITCHVPAIHQDVTEQVDLNLFTTLTFCTEMKISGGETILFINPLGAAQWICY